MQNDSLFQHPEAWRVIWHDALKVSTAVRAFAEVAQDGLYGPVAPELASAIQLLSAVTSEQELLIRTLQALSKDEARSGFGEVIACDVFAMEKHWVLRTREIFAAKHIEVVVTGSPVSVMFPAAYLDALFAMLFAILAHAPSGKGGSLSCAAVADGVRLSLKIAEATLSPDFGKSSLEQIFSVDGNAWSDVERSVFALERHVAAAGGSIVYEHDSATIQITLPLHYETHSSR